MPSRNIGPRVRASWNGCANRPMLGARLAPTSRQAASSATVANGASTPDSARPATGISAGTSSIIR
jgi:hypothetical protein